MKPETAEQILSAASERDLARALDNPWSASNRIARALLCLATARRMTRDDVAKTYQDRLANLNEDWQALESLCDE